MTKFSVKEIDGDKVMSAVEVESDDLTVAASIAIGQYVRPGCDPDTNLVVMVTEVGGRKGGVYCVIDWNTPQADPLTPRLKR